MLGFLHSLKKVVRIKLRFILTKSEYHWCCFWAQIPKKMWSWKCLGIYVILIRLGMHLFFATKIMVWKWIAFVDLEHGGLSSMFSKYSLVDALGSPYEKECFWTSFMWKPGYFNGNLYAGVQNWNPSESARMYPQDKYQNLVATSTIVAVPVCVFLFIVSIFLMNLLVAQLSQSYHDAYSNMQAGCKVGTGIFGDVRRKACLFIS